MMYGESFAFMLLFCLFTLAMGVSSKIKATCLLNSCNFRRNIVGKKNIHLDLQTTHAFNNSLQ